MRETWFTGAAALALTLIPAAALATVPHKVSSKPVAHGAPTHQAAAHRVPVHHVAQRAPAHHVAAHAPAPHDVSYIPPAYHAPAPRAVAYIPPAYHPPTHQVVTFVPPAYHPPAHRLVAYHPPARRAIASASHKYHPPVRQAVAFHETAHPAIRREVAFHPATPPRAVYYPRWESCVPFARDVSGISVPGNARDWWYTAAGHYARGHRPEPGSVLDFRGIRRMPLGHVSVVMRIVNTREILVEHANWWGPGSNDRGISRDIPVIDVSPENDWTEVRVSLGRPGEFGSVYPTYGFIYDRPDNGVILANTPAAPLARRVEVAEAPAAAKVESHALHHSLLDLGGGGH